jgi:hypothetical protein
MASSAEKSMTLETLQVSAQQLQFALIRFQPNADRVGGDVPDLDVEGIGFR